MKRITIALWLSLLASTGWAQSVTNPSPVGNAGAYNTIAPTCTDSQFCYLQTDVNGNLKIVGGGSGGSLTVNQGTAGASPWPVIDSSSTPAGTNLIGSTAPVDAIAQFTGTCTSACTNTTLFTADTTGYRTISLEVTTAGTGTLITYQGSDDLGACSSATYRYSVNGYNTATTTATASPASQASSSTAIGLMFPVTTRCFRAQITAYGSGSPTVQGYLRAAPMPPFPAAGAMPIATATGGSLYSHIGAGQATTVVKNSAGTLYSITFNSAATVTNVTTVYDNASTSGTVIAIPTATAVVAPTTLNFGPVGIAFANGLTIITTTANGSDMTVAYK